MLKFVYDEGIISIARSLGCRWVVNAGGWAIYRSPENLKALQRAFRDMAIVDTSKVGVPMSSEEENHLFDSVPEAYVEALREAGFQEKKLVVYCSLLREFLQYHANKDELNLRLEDFRSYLDHQAGKKLSGGIQTKTRDAIGLYFEKVLGWKKNELSIPSEKPSEELPNLMSEEDLTRLLKATNNAKYKAMISLLYESDLSLDDLSGLLLKDLDLNKNSVELTGKKEGQCKFLFLSQNSKDLVQKYLQVYKPRKWVFERTNAEEAYLPQKILSIVRQFAFKAGLGNMIKPYSLRQSFTKNLKEKGLDNAEIRSLLGKNEQKKSTEKRAQDQDLSDHMDWGS